MASRMAAGAGRWAIMGARPLSICCDDMLTSDPKNRVRAAAAEAIGKLRPADAESLLRTALETDADAGVQKSAGEALRALGFEVDEINDGGWE